MSTVYNILYNDYKSLEEFYQIVGSQADDNVEIGDMIIIDNCLGKLYYQIKLNSGYSANEEIFYVVRPFRIIGIVLECPRPVAKKGQMLKNGKYFIKTRFFECSNSDYNKYIHLCNGLVINFNPFDERLNRIYPALSSNVL